MFDISNTLSISLGVCTVYGISNALTWFWTSCLIFQTCQFNFIHGDWNFKRSIWYFAIGQVVRYRASVRNLRLREHYEEILNEVKFSTKVFHKVIYLLKDQEFTLWITSKHKSTEFTTQSHRKKKSLNQKNEGEVKKQKLWDTHSENK